MNKDQNVISNAIAQEKEFPYKHHVKSHYSKIAPSPAAKQKYLQDILWRESLLAIRISLECTSKNELVDRLREELTQNSATTRTRHTSTVLARYFPAPGVDSIARQVLCAYRDEHLLSDLLAILLPMSEPVIGELIANRLHPLSAGTELSANFFTSYGQEVDHKSAQKISTRCSTAAQVTGWTSRQGRKTYRLYRSVNKTVALILLHDVYAPTPRIVELHHILSEPVWKYLGFQDHDQVRGYCRFLEQKQLIARYVQVDRLDQITTRYSLPEILMRKIIL